jgi:xanthine dehydrogenase molybdopterin-binding subunit B
VPTTGWDWAKGEGQPFHYFTSGVAASEVIIDTLTGVLLSSFISIIFVGFLRLVNARDFVL